MANNKGVIAFNLPAHGCYKSSKTNLKVCKEAFKLVITQDLLESFNLSIIAHSFGSAITVCTLSELDIEVNKLIFLTCPNRIEDVFLDYKNKLV